MANNPKGLGKGLAALLGDDVIDSQEEKEQSVSADFSGGKLRIPTPQAI